MSGPRPAIFKQKIRSDFISYWQLLAGTEVKKIIGGKSLVTFWRKLELTKNSEFENLEFFN